MTLLRGEKSALTVGGASRGIGGARWRPRATLPVNALDLMFGVLHEVAALLRGREGPVGSEPDLLPAAESVPHDQHVARCVAPQGHSAWRDSLLGSIWD